MGVKQTTKQRKNQVINWLTKRLNTIINYINDNVSTDLEGIITFMPSRAHKLHKCDDLNCSCYGGYYKVDHKHKQLPNIKNTH